MDIVSIEEYIQKVKSVIGCKVNINEVNTNEIKEIHILANSNRSPKQIIRDIEAILLVKFDLAIDHKIISIAQIEEDVVDNRYSTRLILKDISQHNEGSTTTVNVTLVANDNCYEATQSGINTISNMRRLVSVAVLKSIEQYYGKDYMLHLEDIQMVNLSGTSAVIIKVSSLISGDEEIFIGSAVVKQDINSAVARATLDSVNRYIGKLQLNY